MYVEFKLSQSLYSNQNKGPSCRDRMVVGFRTTYAISDVVSSDLDQVEVYNIIW
jgi:hypothetical protein